MRQDSFYRHQRLKQETFLIHLHLIYLNLAAKSFHVQLLTPHPTPFESHSIHFTVYSLAHILVLIFCFPISFSVPCHLPRAGGSAYCTYEWLSISRRRARQSRATKQASFTANFMRLAGITSPVP